MLPPPEPDADVPPTDPLSPQVNPSTSEPIAAQGDSKTIAEVPAGRPPVAGTFKERIGLFKDIFAMLQSLATIAAIVAGLVWFLLQQPFSRRLEHSTSYSHRDDGQQTTLIVDLSGKNMSLLPVHLGCFHVSIAGEHGEMYFSEPIRKTNCGDFTDGMTIESGEPFRVVRPLRIPTTHTPHVFVRSELYNAQNGVPWIDAYEYAFDKPVK